MQNIKRKTESQYSKPVTVTEYILSPGKFPFHIASTIITRGGDNSSEGAEFCLMFNFGDNNVPIWIILMTPFQSIIDF